MENNELNDRVLKKLQQKIAASNFLNLENVQKKTKNKFIITTKVASILTIVSLIGGNIYTFATYNENLFSWTLRRVGILEEYNENKKIVNISNESNGIKLTVMDYGIDKNNLIVGYKLELPEKQENLDIQFTETAKFQNTNSMYPLSSHYRDVKVLTKISDTEYEIYRFYDIDSVKLLNNKVNFINDIIIYKHKESSEELGNWKFDFEIDMENVNIENQEYEVECESIVLNNRANTTINILAIQKSQLATRIIFAVENAYMDNVGEYTIEILDENNNVILEDGIQVVLDESKTFTDVIIGKNSLTSKIKLIVYEKDENGEILSEGTTEIDFNKDLVLKVEKTKDLKQIKVNDIKLSYDANNVEFEEQIVENSAFLSLVKEYKNKKYYIGTVFIDSYSNKLNTTNLNILAKDYIDVQSCFVGADCKLEEEYEINIFVNNNSILVGYKLTHDELMRVINGDVLEKDGITISRDIMAIGEIKYNDIKNVNINGIDAVKWTQEDAMGRIENKYMFIINGNIYVITSSAEVNCQEQVNEIVNSITLK